MENLGTNLKNERLRRNVQKARLRRQAVKQVLDHFEGLAVTSTLPWHEADNGDICYRYDPATAFPAAQQGAACCVGGVCNNQQDAEHKRVCPSFQAPTTTSPKMWRETIDDRVYVLGAMRRMSNLYVSVDGDGIIMLTDKPPVEETRLVGIARPTADQPTSGPLCGVRRVERRNTPSCAMRPDNLGGAVLKMHVLVHEAKEAQEAQEARDREALVRARLNEILVEQGRIAEMMTQQHHINDRQETFIATLRNQPNEISTEQYARLAAMRDQLPEQNVAPAEKKAVPATPAAPTESVHTNIPGAAASARPDHTHGVADGFTFIAATTGDANRDVEGEKK